MSTTMINRINYLRDVSLKEMPLAREYAIIPLENLLFLHSFHDFPKAVMYNHFLLNHIRRICLFCKSGLGLIFSSTFT